jgi:hypothetical protein
MSEIDLCIGELRSAAQSLNTVADRLEELFSQSESAVKPITLEQVRMVLAEKSRDGYTADVRALLEKHGAGKLSEIDPSEYPALLAEAEVMGNG